MDLAALHAPIQKDIERRIARLVSTSSFVLGPAVEAFEANFAEYCEARYAVGCSSGTSALHMALTALDIGPGDEVITVSHTFVGTVWGILYCGATPVYVDIDPHTMTMDTSRLEELITERTRAIIAVHLYGQPVNMGPLVSIAQQHGLYIIEDAAQAHGARYQGRRVGSLGHMACFSFYPGKNLGAWGEAGAVVTSIPEFSQRLRRLRDHGQPKRYHHVERGYNYRMDAIQGAVLDVKLQYLDGWNARRAELAQAYQQVLRGAPGLRLPAYGDHSESVHHLFVIRHERRDDLGAELASRGIATGLHYPQPVHRQAGVSAGRDRLYDLPETDRVAASCLSLPLFPTLSGRQLRRVSEAVIASLDAI
jgi:dTDP-4-amino-4,6-dideoxygalactose transaminase